MKNDIKNATLDSFKYDIKTFNKWFNDKRSVIIREEGKKKYSEYTCVIFKTYLTAKNQEFLDTLKGKEGSGRMGSVLSPTHTVMS